MCGYLNALKDKLTDTPVVEITLNRTPSSSQQQQQWLDQPEAVTGPINNSLVEVVQIYIYIYIYIYIRNGCLLSLCLREREREFTSFLTSHYKSSR
jgi:hypothetical protein